MIPATTLNQIINSQHESLLKKHTIERELQIPIDTERIVIISGVRRCGKSTLLRKRFLDNNSAIYINFEDPRLISFELEDFDRLENILKESNRTHLILDEVQNIDKWELYARMAHEKGISLYITGSNASMLSRELGTRLTGRYHQSELYPFSYNEFLEITSKKRSLDSFDLFFEQGGFPEYIKETDSNYHRTLLKDILTRDIAVRRNISNEHQLVRLAVHLLSNIGKEFSFNKLAKLLEFKSVRTVIDYCDYMKESYIMDFIPIFSPSIKKQIFNPKKVYSIDPAFAKSNSLSFSKDLGRRLENFVYNKLRREYNEIFYYRDSNTECDFIIKEGEEVVRAIQVCWAINSENIDREVSGLMNAVEKTGAAKGEIITYNQEDKLKGIALTPCWKWL